MGADGLFFYREFLLTRPSRGVTRSSVTAPLYSGFLLTRPSRGVTGAVDYLDFPITTFLLTRPSRGVTLQNGGVLRRACYFYSHAPRGA